MENPLHKDVDFYQLLGVDRQAKPSEVKKAYRALVKQYHPDLNKDPKAINVFQNIQSAYEILSDPYKRSIYDHLLYRKEQKKAYPHYNPNYKRKTQKAQSYYQARKKGKAHYNKHQPQTKGQFIKFNIKQTIGLTIILAIISVAVILTGMGANFLFFKDFNGSLVAGYFTSAAGLGLIYGSGKAINELVNIWRTGIMNYHAQNHGQENATA